MFVRVMVNSLGVTGESNKDRWIDVPLLERKLIIWLLVQWIKDRSTNGGDGRLPREERKWVIAG